MFIYSKSDIIKFKNIDEIILIMQFFCHKNLHVIKKLNIV